MGKKVVTVWGISKNVVPILFQVPLHQTDAVRFWALGLAVVQHMKPLGPEIYAIQRYVASV